MIFSHIARFFGAIILRKSFTSYSISEEDSAAIALNLWRLTA